MHSVLLCLPLCLDNPLHFCTSKLHYQRFLTLIPLSLFYSIVLRPMSATLTVPSSTRTSTTPAILVKKYPAGSTTMLSQASLPPSISPSCAPSAFTRSALQQSAHAGSKVQFGFPQAKSKLPSFLVQFPSKLVCLVGSIVLIRIFPQLWVYNSAAITALLIVLFELFLYYVVYCMFLYPAYFSPIIYLPTLKVSGRSCIVK